jgi:hypothetical protein
MTTPCGGQLGPPSGPGHRLGSRRKHVTVDLRLTVGGARSVTLSLVREAGSIRSAGSEPQSRRIT